MKVYYQRKDDAEDIIRVTKRPKRSYYGAAVHHWLNGRWSIFFSCTWETQEKVDAALEREYGHLLREHYTQLPKKPDFVD